MTATGPGVAVHHNICGDNLYFNSFILIGEVRVKGKVIFFRECFPK